MYSTDVCLTAVKLLAFVNGFKFNDVVVVVAVVLAVVPILVVVNNNCVGTDNDDDDDDAINADIFVVYVVFGVIIISVFLRLPFVLFTSFVAVFFCGIHLGVLKDSPFLTVLVFCFGNLLRLILLLYFILFSKKRNLFLKS